MPRPPRFFISPSQVSESLVTIVGEDVHHISTVLRLKTGDELRVCDGQGMEYTVKITQVSKLEIRTEVDAIQKKDIPFPRITLGQGIPKSDKMDWIVQKATELGVSAIVPLVTERTIVKVKDEVKRVIRWQKIAREAAMQSIRPDIPLVEPIQRYNDFLQTLGVLDQNLLLIPWEDGKEAIKVILRQHPSVKKIIVLIGPEGGFSKHEAESSHGRGFHLVSLGQNILRSETAAVAVLSMIAYEFH